MYYHAIEVALRRVGFGFLIVIELIVFSLGMIAVDSGGYGDAQELRACLINVESAIGSCINDLAFVSPNRGLE